MFRSKNKVHPPPPPPLPQPSSSPPPPPPRSPSPSLKHSLKNSQIIPYKDQLIDFISQSTKVKPHNSFKIPSHSDIPEDIPEDISEDSDIPHDSYVIVDNTIDNYLDNYLENLYRRITYDYYHNKRIKKNIIIFYKIGDYDKILNEGDVDKSDSDDSKIYGDGTIYSRIMHYDASTAKAHLNKRGKEEVWIVSFLKYADELVRITDIEIEDYTEPSPRIYNNTWVDNP